jgi:thiamine pyrophosphokinase
MLAEGVMARRVLVVTDGGPTSPDPDALAHPAAVIAADGGVAEALRLGLPVDVVVGDLDSAAPEHVRTVEAAGGRVRRHPTDKDATDLELALDEAMALGADEVLVLGGALGRLDHLLGNLLVLASERFAGMQVDGYLGAAAVHVIRGRRRLLGAPGELVSLLPVGGVARDVRTRGLRWALLGEDLTPGTTRGLSNRFVAPIAEVELASGVLVAVRPHPLGEEPRP